MCPGQAQAEAIMNTNAEMTDADSLIYLINGDSALPNAHFKVAMDTTMPLRKVLSVGHSTQGGVAAIEVTYRHKLSPFNIWNNPINHF